MNQLATMAGAELAVGERTKDLIVRGVSANTLKAYRRALKDLEAWLRDAANVLNDGVLAAYLTELHDSGKSPATVSQVVAAVKWQAKNLRRECCRGNHGANTGGDTARRERTRSRSSRRDYVVGYGAGVRLCRREQVVGGAEGFGDDSAHERLSVANFGGGGGRCFGHRLGVDASLQ